MVISILKLIAIVSIVYSIIALWPAVQGWRAVRQNSVKARKLVEEGERFRADKLEEITKLRSADKARMKSIDTVIVKAIGVNKKEAARTAPIKKELLQELEDLKTKIGASERSISEDLRKIETLKELQESCKTRSEAVQVLRNRIKQLEENGQKLDVDSGKLELTILDLADAKHNLSDAVASAEAELDRIIASSKASAERDREIQERAFARGKRLSEGIQVFKKITNGQLLQSILVRGGSSGSSRAEFAKVYPDGRVFVLNESVLEWERFGDVDADYSTLVDELFSRIKEPLIVRGRFDLKPAMVFLPLESGLRFLTD